MAGLYNILKVWRLEQARAYKVSACVVFTDPTLEELLSARPQYGLIDDVRKTAANTYC